MCRRTAEYREEDFARFPMLALCSQEQVARQLGVRREAVRATEHRALRKLRREIKRQAELAGVTPQEWLHG